MQVLIHIRSLFSLLLFAGFLGAASYSAHAQALSAPEYKIKAAFLYNFAVLTQWPTNAFDSPKAPLVIGVLGKDPFGRYLDETMKGKTIAGRKIEVRRYKDPDDIETCHLLFISSSEEEHVKGVFSQLQNRPVLTVSEIHQFNYLGGMIWLRKQGDEIKFRIRQSVVKDSGLRMSSKLLALSINGKPEEKEAR